MAERRATQSRRRSDTRASVKGASRAEEPSHPKDASPEGVGVSDLNKTKRNHEEMTALSKGLAQGIEALEKGGVYRGYDYLSRPDQEDDDACRGDQLPGSSGAASPSNPTVGPSSATEKAKALQRREAPVISSQRAANAEQDDEGDNRAEGEETDDAEAHSDEFDDCSSENSFLEYEPKEIEESIKNEKIDTRIQNARNGMEKADEALKKLKTLARYQVAHNLNFWFQGSLVGCDQRLAKLKKQEETHGETLHICDESLDEVRALLSSNEMDSLCKMNQFGAKLRGYRFRQLRAQMEGSPDDDTKASSPKKFGAEERCKDIDRTIKGLKEQIGAASRFSEMSDDPDNEAEMPKASDLLQVIADQQEEVRQLSIQQQQIEARIKLAELCKGIPPLNRKHELLNWVPQTYVDGVFDLLKDIRDGVKQKALVKKMQEDSDLKYQLMSSEDDKGKPDDKKNGQDFYRDQAGQHANLVTECSDLDAIIAHLKQLRETDAYSRQLEDQINKAMAIASGFRAAELGDDSSTNPFGAGGMGFLFNSPPSPTSVQPQAKSRVSMETAASIMGKLVNSAEGVVAQLMKEKKRLFPNIDQAPERKDKVADGRGAAVAAAEPQRAKRKQSHSVGGSETVVANAGGPTANSTIGAAPSDASKNVAGVPDETKPEPKAEPVLKRGRRARQQQQDATAAQADGPPAASTKAEDTSQRSTAAQAQNQSDPASAGNAQASAVAQGSSGQKKDGQSWAHAGSQKAKEKKTDKKGAETENVLALVSSGPPVTDEDLSACEEEHGTAKANLEKLQSECEAMTSETARLEARLAELKAKGMPPTLLNMAEPASVAPPQVEPGATLPNVEPGAASPQVKPAASADAPAPPDVSGALQEEATAQPADKDTETSEALSTIRVELDGMVNGNEGLRKLIEELEARLESMASSLDGVQPPGVMGSSRGLQSSRGVQSRGLHSGTGKRPKGSPSTAVRAGQSKHKEKGTPRSDATPPKTPVSAAAAVAESKGISKVKTVGKKQKTKDHATMSDETLADAPEVDKSKGMKKGRTKDLSQSHVPEASGQQTSSIAHNTTERKISDDHEPHTEIAEEEHKAKSKKSGAVLDLLAKRPKKGEKGHKLMEVMRSAAKAKKAEQYKKDIEEIYHIHEDAAKLEEEIEMMDGRIKAIKAQGSGEVMKMFTKDKDAHNQKVAAEVPDKIIELRQSVGKKQHELKKLRQIWWNKKPAGKNGKISNAGAGAGAGAGPGAGPGAGAGADSASTMRWNMVRQQSQGMSLMERVLHKMSDQDNLHAAVQQATERRLSRRFSVGQELHSQLHISKESWRSQQPDSAPETQQASHHFDITDAAPKHRRSRRLSNSNPITDALRLSSRDGSSDDQSSSVAVVGKGQHPMSSKSDNGTSPPPSTRGIQVVRSGGFRIKLRTMATLAKMGEQTASSPKMVGTGIVQLDNALPKAQQVLTTPAGKKQPLRRSSLADLLSSQGVEGEMGHKPLEGLSSSQFKFNLPVPKNPNLAATMGPHFVPGAASMKKSPTRGQNRWFQAVKLAVGSPKTMPELQPSTPNRLPLPRSRGPSKPSTPVKDERQMSAQSSEKGSQSSFEGSSDSASQKNSQSAPGQAVASEPAAEVRELAPDPDPASASYPASPSEPVSRLQPAQDVTEAESHA